MAAATINVITVGENLDAYHGREEILKGLKILSEKHTICGRDRHLDMSVEGDSLFVSGGRLHLKKTEIRFVVNEMDAELSSYSYYIKQWLEGFDAVIIWVSAEELYSSHKVRLAAADLRLAMQQVGRYQDAPLFMAGIEKVLDIQKHESTAYTQLGIYGAIAGMPYNNTRFLPGTEYTEYSDMLAIAQNNIVFEKQDGSRFAVPLATFCQDCSNPESGMAELLQFVVNKAFERKGFRINIINTKIHVKYGSI